MKAGRRAGCGRDAWRLVHGEKIKPRMELGEFMASIGGCIEVAAINDVTDGGSGTAAVVVNPLSVFCDREQIEISTSRRPLSWH
eukprot:CCRYP_014941-RD/>CCRYP_014941-RD protein AED:0.47 eAED:0.88 QI:0/0/0/1/0/0/2/0/83